MDSITSNPNGEGAIATGDATSPSGISQQDARFVAAVDHVINSMIKVEREMNRFRNYLSTQDSNDKPLFQWAKYVRYPALIAAVQTLDSSVASLQYLYKGESITQLYVPQPLADARHLSTSISNVAVFAMAVMNRKSTAVTDELETTAMEPTAKDMAKKIITEEIGKLVKHSTEATNSVWAATDLLQKIFIPDQRYLARPKPQPGLNRRGWLTLLLMLMCFGIMVFKDSTTVFVVHRPDINTTGKFISTASIDNLHKDVHKAYELFAKSTSLTNQSYDSHDAKLFALNRRYAVIERSLEDNSIRIDNLWEALGPPDENGTYDFHQKDCSSKEYEQNLAKLREEWMMYLKKIDADAKQLRKEMQKFDVRVSSRMDRLERKRS